VTEEDNLLLSPAMKAELIDVFHRSKFDSQVSLEGRLSFLYYLFSMAAPVTPTEVVTDCVDVKDNMILACALCGNADVIMTGDDHLLRLTPWRSIPILTPAQYLALKPGEGLR
jgi:putative PIN family toxin of toxin-antitoxin system